MNTDKMAAMNAAAEAVKKRSGWVFDGGPAAATRCFESICGPKLAHIWLGRQPDQVGNFRVVAEYWSEGRNICESAGLIINVDTPLAEIPCLVSRFLQQIESIIKQSFAVRLLEAETIGRIP